MHTDPLSRASRLAGLLLSGALASCSSSSAGANTSTFADSGGGTDTSVGSTPESGSDGSAGGGYDGGSFGTGDASDDAVDVPTSIVATIRDFRFYDAGDPTTNQDFENVPAACPCDDKGIVATTLGADDTPTYVGGATGTSSTHGPQWFQMWYHDTPGSNITVMWPVPIVANPTPDAGAGSSGYDSQIQGMPYGNTPSGAIAGNGFFPIDDGTPYATAFGNQGWPNNYSFTCEIHTAFTYKGGEYFNFRGDDDVFVFINKQLVINLGGIHDPEAASVQLDSLGLTVGQNYPLDFFSAERHVTGSNILFETTLVLQTVQ